VGNIVIDTECGIWSPK